MNKPRTGRTGRTGRWAMAMAAFVGLGLLVEPSLAAGADASEWAVGHNARVRLVTGPRESSGDRLIGIEIDFAPGWHTYWRNPGDSGVPPVFDWSRSGNLDAAEILWPAPLAIDTGYGMSIGYEDGVVFPVRLRPARAGEPIEAALKLDYAVCDEICIPLSAELSLTLAPQGDSASTENLVETALSSVPQAQPAGVPAAQGDAGPGPRIIGARTERRGGKIMLLVDARAEGVASLFVEGPAEYYFSVPPVPEPMAGGAVRFTVEVDGAKAAGDLVGKRIGATLVAGGAAVEHWWSVE